MKAEYNFKWKKRKKKNIEHLHHFCNCSSVNLFCLFSFEFSFSLSHRADSARYHELIFRRLTHILPTFLLLPHQTYIPSTPNNWYNFKSWELFRGYCKSYFRYFWQILNINKNMFTSIIVIYTLYHSLMDTTRR